MAMLQNQQESHNSGSIYYHGGNKTTKNWDQQPFIQSLAWLLAKYVNNLGQVYQKKIMISQGLFFKRLCTLKKHVFSIDMNLKIVYHKKQPIKKQ